tara:strand:+ start:175 stop:462 length:288 start_codon:yes stop_codon:yes gene_type:complete
MSNSIKINYDLNSLKDELIKSMRIMKYIENPNMDLYIIMDSQFSFEYRIYKTMNQSLNSPGFVLVNKFDNYLECELWIEDDIEYSKQVKNNHAKI